MAILVGVAAVLVFHAGCRPHTDVLVKELLSCEVIHEVFRCDETTLFLVLLEKDLIELLANSLHDLFEFKRHSFVLERADIFTELLVNLADHPLDPALNLIVDQLYLFIELLGFLVFLLLLLDGDV